MLNQHWWGWVEEERETGMGSGKEKWGREGKQRRDLTFFLINELYFLDQFEIYNRIKPKVHSIPK